MANLAAAMLVDDDPGAGRSLDLVGYVTPLNEALGRVAADREEDRTIG